MGLSVSSVDQPQKSRLLSNKKTYAKELIIQELEVPQH